MDFNLYNILQEQLLTEDRVSKIQSKVKKIIMASNPNMNWQEQVNNNNGNAMPYIQMVCNSFVSRIFGYGFCDANMELAPHAAEIAFNELDYLNNPDSSDVGLLKKIVKYISNNLDNSTLSSFNSSDFNSLTDTYGDILNDINADKRNSLVSMGNSGNYNGYTIHEINHFEESQEYFQFTQSLRIPWCLTHRQDMFNDYGSSGKDKIYFISHEGFENVQQTPNQSPTWDVPKQGDAPYDEYGYSLICIIVDEKGELTYCTPRWNHEYGHTDDFLDEGEISQLIQADFYQVFTPYTEEEIKERQSSGEFGDNEEDWYDNIIYLPDGGEVGYFKDGKLYDMDREELSDGYWDSYQALTVGKRAIMLEYRTGQLYDIYTVHRGELSLEYEEVRDITINDAFVYEREGVGIVIGIDKDEDFVCCNMDNDYQDCVGRGIQAYKELASEEFYLLKYNDNKHYGIVYLSNDENLEVVYGIINPEEIEIDFDTQTIYFYEYDIDYDSPKNEDGTRNYKWVKKKIGFYDYQSDWEYADDEDTEEEEEDENELSFTTESVKKDFWKKVNEINESFNKNLPLKLD